MNPIPPTSVDALLVGYYEGRKLHFAGDLRAVGLQLDGRRQWELATKQPFQWVRGLRRPAFQVVGMHIDKQVNPATHGKVIAAKLSELGVARRRGR